MKPDPDEITWDPGGVHCTIKSSYLWAVISAATMNDPLELEGDSYSGIEGRTDLDSHANMPVVGRLAKVLSFHDKSVEVPPHSLDYKPMKVPLVDAAVKYESPFDGRVCILVIRNALYVPSMENNLLPPFMIREAGVILKDTPKIQLVEPTEEDHAIFFPETELRIPLSLFGVF